MPPITDFPPGDPGEVLPFVYAISTCAKGGRVAEREERAQTSSMEMPHPDGPVRRGIGRTPVAAAWVLLAAGLLVIAFNPGVPSFGYAVF